MAKQSFSVGQVLTAAQMNSLQQTAMLGGSATAKTASYTLVAADAGTVVSVNSTSATTITVNTALFSAGDTVTIQNWGSGAVTITAGTATVNTAGSLIVPQYDGGVLYFTSASAAIYFDFVQAGAVSPLTTKGDLYGFGSSDARIPIGTNGQILTADSAETLGLKWATPAGGTRGLQQIIPTSVAVTSGTASVGANGKVTLTGARNLSVNGCFTSTYTNYVVVADLSGDTSGADCTIRMRVGGSDNTTANSYKTERFYVQAGALTAQSANTTSFNAIAFAGSNGGTGFTINFFRPFLTKATLIGNINSPVGGFGNYYSWSGAGVHTEATSYDGFTLMLDQDTTGNLMVYGWSE